VGYHSSMITEGFVGIIKIDKDVAFCSVTDETEIACFAALRQKLYTNFKLSDGHSLIAEVHQSGPQGCVEILMPNTPVAETMVKMMNKNIAASLTYFLMDQGMDKNFVNAWCQSRVILAAQHQ